VHVLGVAYLRGSSCCGVGPTYLVRYGCNIMTSSLVGVQVVKHAGAFVDRHGVILCSENTAQQTTASLVRMWPVRSCQGEETTAGVLLTAYATSAERRAFHHSTHNLLHPTSPCAPYMCRTALAPARPVISSNCCRHQGCHEAEDCAIRHF
jgi:hypothetical protein